MADEFRKIPSREPVVPGEILELRPLASSFSFSPETSIDRPSVSCRSFVNDCLNSRLAQTLPVGDWIISSSAPLKPGSRPKHILHASDRIILEGDGPWQLFDQKCELIEQGYLDGSGILIDAANNLFFFSDPTGMIEARDLTDGSRTFCASLLFGPDFYRSFMARRSEKLVVVSIEREIDQDAEKRPEDTTIEVLRFDDPPIIDEDKILRSSQVVSELLRKNILLLSAMNSETLVTVTKDQISLLDIDLQIKTRIDGKFEPFVVSLNNAGIIFMVLYDRGSSKLRAIRPNGERIYSTELPPEMSDIIYPPIITYHNRVFLIKDNHLIAFAANGHYLWEYKSSNNFAGAVVTAGNQLLISDGAELGVFESNGNYRTLYEFKEETLQTPPTITASGNLIVATDKKLYSLAIKPKQ